MVNTKKLRGCECVGIAANKITILWQDRNVAGAPISHQRYHAASSTVLPPPLWQPNLLSRPLRPALLACDRARLYSALEDGNRSGDLTRS